MRKTRDNVPTIRSQLTRIVLIPSVCFLALWLVVAAVGTVQAIQLMGAVTQAREGTETFSEAADELRAERRLSLVYLGRFERSGPDTEAGTALDEQRETTDAALAEAVELAERMRGTRDDEVQRSAIAVLGGPEALEEIRLLIDEHSARQEEVVVGYSEIIGGSTDAVTALVHTTDGGENLTDAVLTSELIKARAEYATADALLAGVIARDEMNHEETAHFTYLTASYRDTLGSANAVMHPTVRARYEAMTSDGSWTRTEQLSRQVVTRPPIVEVEPAAPDPEVEPVEPGSESGSEDGTASENEGPVIEWNTDIDVGAAAWDDSSGRSDEAIGGLVRAQAERTVDLAWSAALMRVSLGVAAAGLILMSGMVAIAVVGRSSRRLTDRLARLRGQIMERDDDLPEIVDRAQRGQKVDVQEELPPLDEYGDDEIGQVAEAFDSAQLTAVEAAVRQAEIRRGANRAFLGIAFRNQALVQRQLRLLDEIEYNEQDSEALRRLFRLDHLATRARRYADNLIILGGGQSTRRWRQPRPLVDVLRSAIAETEDFERVRLISAPRVLMHGQAVADVVHLLAELVENATQFSPVGTPVDVSCAPAAEGLVVEVEDRGLGMSEHGYAAAERTLTQPPEFDVMALPDDPRLGLFVVARLAERHGVRVWLRPSSYGGTRATTLIPGALLEPVEQPVAVAGPPMGAQNPPGGSGGRYGGIVAPAGSQNGQGGFATTLSGPQISIASDGRTGPNGYTGPHRMVPLSGPSGSSGPNSPSGFSGPNGLNGRTGPNGHTGPQTVVPPNGHSGFNGHTGSQGAAPYNGHAGPQGLASPSGPQTVVPSNGHTGPQGSPPPTDRTGPQHPLPQDGSVGQQLPRLPRRKSFYRRGGNSGRGVPQDPSGPQESAPTSPRGHGEN